MLIETIDDAADWGHAMINEIGYVPNLEYIWSYSDLAGKCPNASYHGKKWHTFKTCFGAEFNIVDGCNRVQDMLGILNTGVYVHVGSSVLAFTPNGLVSSNGAKRKFKRDDDFAWCIQKTQFKAKSPYAIVDALTDEFWRRKMIQALISAGIANPVPRDDED